ncbi:hypothetical protein [Sphingomonas sp. RS2018]
MEITRLPPGKQAPLDVDCIRVEQTDESAFKLTASALCVGVDDAESVSIVGAPTFQTAEAAEAAGLVWATNVGVERLYVAVGTLAQPLELLEIDKPL